MLIEAAQLIDADEILKLQKLAFQSEAEIHNNYSIPPLIQSLDSLREDFKTYQFFKGIYNNQLIGAVKVCRLGNNRLSICRLVIHPQYQGMGFGKQLMAFIENHYNDVKGFELFTAEKSYRNIAFYTNLGYRIDRKVKEPEHDDISLVILIKDINV